MPGRKTPFLDQRLREKIQASMLIRALHDCVEGRNKMTSVQVRAAEVLLRKVAPDLAALEYSGETTVKYQISSEPMTVEEWKREIEQEYSQPQPRGCRECLALHGRRLGEKIVALEAAIGRICRARRHYAALRPD